MQHTETLQNTAKIPPQKPIQANTDATSKASADATPGDQATTGAKIGYARISTSHNGQKLDMQIDALKEAGCTKIFTDVSSGAKSERPGYQSLQEYIRPGDTVVVWKLDRLGRSISDLIKKVKYLEDRDINFTSLTESIDTSTPIGQFFFHVMASLAQMEKQILIQRTKKGLEAARARGRMGGAPRRINTKQRQKIVEMHKDKTNTIRDILTTFNISKSSLYRIIQEEASGAKETITNAS